MARVSWVDGSTGLLRYLVEVGDDRTTIVRKKLAMALNFVVLLSTPALFFTAAGAEEAGMLDNDGPRGQLRPLCGIFLACVASFWIIYLLGMRRCSEVTFVVNVVLIFIGFAVRDLFYASALFYHSGTILFISGFDLLLLGRVSGRITACILAAVCVWVAVLSAELWWRFGLLDIYGTMPHSDRAVICSCAAPPCEGTDFGKNGITAGLGVILTLIFDFYCTNRFAHQAQTQTDKLGAAVVHTQRIAKALARFDLARAEASLRASRDGLPDDLYESLSTILSSLAAYRPFLSEALFPQQARVSSNSGFDDLAMLPLPGECEREPPAAAAAAPSLRLKNAALVALRIIDASKLWEESSSAMQSAQAQYDALLRSAINTHDGGLVVRGTPEVYLVAFETAAAAVRFALHAQVRLQDVPWPVDLELRGVAFGVSIGIHYGEVSLEKNVLTSQHDYFGETVSLALRVAELGPPQGVTVSGTVQRVCAGSLNAFELIPGPVADSRVSPTAVLLPPELAHRAGAVQDFLQDQARNLARSHDDTQGPTNAMVYHGGLAGSSATLPPEPLYAPSSNNSTVGVVKLGMWSSTKADLNGTGMAELAVLHKALKETGGMLTTVVSRCIVVSWNAHSECSQHMGRSVQFAIKLYNALHKDQGGSTVFHAGLATGPVPSALMAPSSDLAFITLAGPCVDLSLALCSAALELGTCVLVASTGNGADMHKADPFLSAYLRPVDRWSFRQNHSAGDLVMVLEMQLEALAGAEVPGDGGSIPRWGEGAWSEEYFRAFVLKDTRSLEMWAADDPVVERVCRLLDADEHLAHAMIYIQPKDGDEDFVSSAAASQLTLALTTMEEFLLERPPEPQAH
eukprot:TRINITY_DN1982_c1_g2_i1.p1 TRINITY_DN1982_c1_g2~~TRINITY_DN1982_c1_g2_i1.p1  ORF type:complete len:857 (+),score=195.13 TRINITY_DN1982_c1_g2_i1:38-2608(+)